MDLWTCTFFAPQFLKYHVMNIDVVPPSDALTSRFIIQQPDESHSIATVDVTDREIADNGEEVLLKHALINLIGHWLVLNFFEFIN